MVLAVVRSHYGEKFVDPKQRGYAEKQYRAGNALGTWLGVEGGVIGIAYMQYPENVEELRRRLDDAV